MQWILENPAVWISTLSAAVVSAAAAGWWVKQKYQLQAQLLEQQLTSDARWHEQQIEQLKQTLSAAQQELDELDQERDKAEFELKQSHGKVMAVMEKLRYFEAIKQERQQYADELNRMREQKAQLEVQLREQEARHQQQLEASQDKLQLLERAEERLKQQFEHLANQVFEAKTAKVDQQNRQSLMVCCRRCVSSWMVLRSRSTTASIRKPKSVTRWCMSYVTCSASTSRWPKKQST